MKVFPAFEAQSLFIAGDLGGMLRSPALKRYDFARVPAASAPLPDDVRQLLGWPKRDVYVPGAYQPAQP